MHEVWHSYHAVVGAALSTKVKRFVVIDTLIDDSVGEHGLRSNAIDKDTERHVVSWLGLGPHF